MIATFSFGAVLDHNEPRTTRCVISSRMLDPGMNVWFIETDRNAIVLGYGKVKDVSHDRTIVTLADGTQIASDLCFFTSEEIEAAIHTMSAEIKKVITQAEADE